MTRITIAGVALMLAACDPSGAGNGTQPEASGTVRNEAPQSDATPLPKDQALALMERRHDNYEKIGDAMKLVSRELKAEAPDLGRVRSGAATIAELAPQVPSWFPAGTGPDVGKTEARAEIWQKPDDFAAKAEGFRTAALAFAAAAQGSDLAAIRAAHGNLGKSCKACHDLYREEE